MFYIERNTSFFIILLFRVRNIQTMDELKDVYQYFLLYYGHEIPNMRNAEKKRRARERAEGEGGEEVTLEEDKQDSLIKQATRRSGYSICLKAKLGQSFCQLFWSNNVPTSRHCGCLAPLVGLAPKSDLMKHPFQVSSIPYHVATVKYQKRKD